MKTLRILLLMALLLSCTSIFSQEREEVVMKNILERKSVRTYADKEVSEDQLNQILRAAMAAPSARNSQPWEFIVINKREVLDNLSTQLPYAKMLSNAKAAIIVCGNMEKALEGEGRDFWVQDCSAATQNILLSAESMGLGAVWTGVYPRKEVINIISEEFKLPEHIIPLNVIPIGWQTGKEKPKDKYKKENIHWNGW